MRAYTQYTLLGQKCPIFISTCIEKTKLLIDQIPYKYTPTGIIRKRIKHLRLECHSARCRPMSDNLLQDSVIILQNHSLPCEALDGKRNLVELIRILELLIIPFNKLW